MQHCTGVKLRAVSPTSGVIISSSSRKWLAALTLHNNYQQRTVGILLMKTVTSTFNYWESMHNFNNSIGLWHGKRTTDSEIVLERCPLKDPTIYQDRGSDWIRLSCIRKNYFMRIKFTRKLTKYAVEPWAVLVWCIPFLMFRNMLE